MSPLAVARPLLTASYMPSSGPLIHRMPAEAAMRLRRITDEPNGIRRANQGRIHRDVSLVVEPGAIEGDPAHVPDGVREAGGDDVVGRRIMLQHQPHRPDVVAGEPP